MNSFYLLITFFFTLTLSLAQNHVKWDAFLGENKQEIILKGKIDKGWHLYSSSTPENAGPVPVDVLLIKNKNFKQVGKIKEISAVKFIYDINFGSDVAIIENEYIATIPVKIKKDCTIKGEVYYMICDDEMCLPPITVEFNVTLKK